MKTANLLTISALLSGATLTPLSATFEEPDTPGPAHHSTGHFYVLKKPDDINRLEWYENGTVVGLTPLGEGGSYQYILGYLDRETIVTDPDTGETLTLAEIISGRRFGVTG